MRKLYVPVIDLIRPAAASLAGLALLAGLLTFRVGLLHTGIASHETATVQAIQTNNIGGKDVLMENSLYLPHKAGQYALEKAGFTSVRDIRLLGVVAGLLGAAGFFVIIQKWHTRRVAILTTILYATSSWFLFTSRLAGPESLYLLTPWLIYFGIRLQQDNLRFLGLATITMLLGLMLYIPGLAWFIVPALIWQRKRVIGELRQTGRLKTSLLAVGVLVLMAPLVLTFINNPGLLPAWLGLADSKINIVEILKNLVGVPIQLFVRSDLDPASHVGRLPYLDIATSAFVALGAYRYAFERKLDRTKLIAGGLVLGTVLGGLNFQAAIILLPFLYILVAAGLALLLQQWFTVFPRNPLARNIGVGLVVAVVGLASFYHLRRYYVAWPNTPETKQAYSLPDFRP